MLERCYSLSPRSRLERRAGVHRLICSHPLQILTLNRSAWLLLNALRPGVPIDEVVQRVTPQVVNYLDGLAAQGALRADYRLVPSAGAPRFEVIVPVYANPQGLARCLHGLAGQAYPRSKFRVTVVDDASPAPLQGLVNDLVNKAAANEAPAAGLQLRWLRLPENRGPASARNAAVCTPWPRDRKGPAPLLAFVDSDCVPESGWLAALAALLETPGIAAAGGRVLPLRTGRLLARYEGACASLYLGERPGAVGNPGYPLAYLPACNLAVRRDVYTEMNGFRDGWRFGEDVDLCWRMADAGHGLFYHPAATVAHDYRARWGPFLQRKRLYARSEAMLRGEHPVHFRRVWEPGTILALLLAALALPAGSPAALGLALSAWLVAGAWPVLRWRAKAAPSAKALPPTEAALPAEPMAVRMLFAAVLRRMVGGLLGQCRQLSRATAVLWLPAVALLPDLWPIGLCVYALGAAGEWLARRPGLPIPIFLMGHAGECLAYSLGRVEGAVLRLWRSPWAGYAARRGPRTKRAMASAHPAHSHRNHPIGGDTNG
ncbi:MAG: glycosyltransferase [SAR324 cluster bacterium]|nr:glycosyltransferase [SAR324 cluster bacterium]